ncbi:MAG TPA: hypothetical protein VGN12_16780 [Pirellulales bacterium]
MISEELLSILVCPDNRTPLALADESMLRALNQAIAAGKIKDLAGEAITEQLAAALVRQDRTVAYRVVDRIPILLPESGILLNQVAS